MSDNELILTLSDLLDKKLKPIEHKLLNIDLQLENNILPRLQNIESCYTSTYNRYQTGVSQIDAMQSDIDVIKNVIREHSSKLQKIS